MLRFEQLPELAQEEVLPVAQMEEAMIGNVTNIDVTDVGMGPADSEVGMRPTEGDNDDSVLCYDASSDEEDADMDRPVAVVEEIVSDIVGEFAHKSYFVHLRDGCYYHYPSDKIYGLVRDRPELGPIIWRDRTDSVFENAEVAPLLESG